MVVVTGSGSDEAEAEGRSDREKCSRRSKRMRRREAILACFSVFFRYAITLASLSL